MKRIEPGKIEELIAKLEEARASGEPLKFAASLAEIGGYAEVVSRAYVDVCRENNELKAEECACREDAERYRFLRDSENWGEDSGDDSWEHLSQAEMEIFDEIVDSRMGRCAWKALKK